MRLKVRVLMVILGVWQVVRATWIMSVADIKIKIGAMNRDLPRFYSGIMHNGMSAVTEPRSLVKATYTGPHQDMTILAQVPTDRTGRHHSNNVVVVRTLLENLTQLFVLQHGYTVGA